MSKLVAIALLLSGCADLGDPVPGEAFGISAHHGQTFSTLTKDRTK